MFFGIQSSFSPNFIKLCLSYICEKLYMSAKFWHQDVRVSLLQKITRTFFFEKVNLTLSLTENPLIWFILILFKFTMTFCQPHHNKYQFGFQHAHIKKDWLRDEMMHFVSAGAPGQQMVEQANYVKEGFWCFWKFFLMEIISKFKIFINMKISPNDWETFPC